MKIYNPNGSLILDLDVDDNSYRNRRIMEIDSITLRYSLAEHVELPVGAYIIFENVRYTLILPENFKKKHSRNYDYTVLFCSDMARANQWKFRNTVDGRLKFSLTAKPREHLQMLVDNLNRREKGWTVGDCIEGAEVVITYKHAFCLDALKQMASATDSEFCFEGKRVSLRKIEYYKSNPIPLSYGKGNGFKSGVGRSTQGDRPPVEIVYAEGGTENLDPSKYGNRELLLPKSQTIGFDGEHFSDEAGYNDAQGRMYVSDADGLSVRRNDKALSTHSEDSVDCTSICPKRVGTVSNVVTVDAGNNFYDIVDDSIPQSLNFEGCLIEGEAMTVIFQSGMLAGKEFEVKYYHEAKTVNGVAKKARRFDIVPQEIDGQTMPGGVYIPRAGDTYAVFHCMLPDAYVCDNETKTGASWDMFRKVVRWLFDNEESKFAFTGTLDGIWAKKDWTNIGGRIRLGGYVLFSDKDFQPNGVLVRIVGIKDYINNPHSPEIELSNSTVSAGFSNTMRELKSEEVATEEKHRQSVAFTKRRFRDAVETIGMLEKAMLENFTQSISPITVRTMSMLVGDESLQFRFVNSKTSPVPVTHRIVYDNETKQLTAEAGIIQHMTLGINTVSASHKVSEYKFWDMTAYTSAVLDDGKKKYYLYAKVSKTAQTGVFILSENAIKLEGVSGFYHLLVGVLNSEYDGERSFVTLYGFTEVLPGRITTDKIVSSDGTTYFDLLRGIISGKIKFTSGSSGLYELEEWSEVDKMITDVQTDTDNLKKELGTLDSTVDSFQEFVEGAFADGIITEAEKVALEKNIRTIETTEETVKATYEKLIENSYLAGIPKEELETAYGTLSKKIKTLKDLIRNAIEDNKITDDEDTGVDKAFTDFNTAISAFYTAVEAANKAIQDALKKYSDDALSQAKTALDSAKNAMAKDLGYTDFADLEKKAKAGETIIEGGKINTTLIDAKAIVTAALLAELVKVTELVAEHLTVTGSSKIAGFSVSGNGLTNTPFNNDAYVIFRNDAHKCFAGIGGNVLPASSGLRAVARFENEDMSDWWGLNRNIATLFSAKNGRYNHAFLGSGNGNLDGWIGGYKYSKYNLTSANIIYSGYSNLKDNNRWVIYSSVNDSGITLPKLSEVRDALGIGSSTNFCVDFTIIADLDSKDFYIYGRNGKKSSDSTYPWNTDEYPNLVHWNNDHWDSVTMGPGDSLTVLLIYDSAKSGNKGGYPLTYTARIINRQN